MVILNILGKIEAVTAKVRLISASRLHAGVVFLAIRSYKAKQLFVKAAGAILGAMGDGVLATPRLIKRIREARKFWLFLAEVAGVVLVAFGISLWSIPAAIIIGGLVLVAAVEVRPRVVPTMPNLPVPDEFLRQQAERAAQVINNVRFGLPVVDEKALSKLSREECERVIQAARAIGAKQQAKA